MNNHYRIDGPALIAFSGGASSGFMLWNIIEAHGGTLPQDVKVTFCNTGLEHEETYRFVERCSIEWSVPIIWLEYRRVEQSHSFIVVDYVTASRKGEPFTQLIESRSYLPNPIARFCTVEMKIRTMDRYGKSIGLENYSEAIGLRADEPHRVSRIKETNRRNEAICPMAKAGHTLKDVEQFWKRQPFKLNIERYLGNCVGCFLKSRASIERVAREYPEMLDWWVEQEQKARDWGEQGFAKSETFRKDRPSYANIINQVREQPLLFEDDDHETIPCMCTD